MSSDPSSGIVRATGRLAYDVLGPTAKYLGKELRGLSQTGVKNLKRVLKKAKSRQAQLGIEGGSIPARVLPPLLRSAYFCEDEVAAAYLGGVICSAQTPVGRDDRAVSFLKVIEGLSSYALRAHCIVYASVLLQRNHKMIDVKESLMRGRGITVVFDESAFQKQMQFVDPEDPDAILAHAFVNLSANDLSMQGIRSVLVHKTDEKIRWMHPTMRGVELFCWGTGLGQAGIDTFFSRPEVIGEAEALGIVPLKTDLGLVSYS